MSNLTGPGGSPGNSGGGGVAIVAVPLVLIATLSVRSGVFEGCGRQSVKAIDEFVPTRIEKTPNLFPQHYTPPKKLFDDKTVPYDPYGTRYPEAGKTEDDKSGDLIDLGKDALEETLQPKDTTNKK